MFKINLDRIFLDYEGVLALTMNKNIIKKILSFGLILTLLGIPVYTQCSAMGVGYGDYALAKPLVFTKEIIKSEFIRVYNDMVEITGEGSKVTDRNIFYCGHLSEVMDFLSSRYYGKQWTNYLLGLFLKCAEDSGIELIG